MALVDIKQAADHLRLGIDFGADFVASEFDIDDYPNEPRLPELIDKLAQAEAIVLNYLKIETQSPAWEPSASDTSVVTSAILLILGSLWEFREDTSASGGGASGGINMLAADGTVAHLLMRLRDPAMA